MHRYKIHEHTDFVFVAGIDKIPQVIRCSVAGCRCKKAGILIPPGFIAGMLTQWHQFYIIVSVFIQIRNQQICHLPISIPSFRIIIHFFSPGTEMYLINIQRCFPMNGTFFHPFTICKMIIRCIIDNGCTVRT